MKSFVKILRLTSQQVFQKFKIHIDFKKEKCKSSNKKN